MNDLKPPSSTSLVVQRLRLDSVRRLLTLKAIEPVTPRMLRITFAGDELSGFHSPSPDDHIKVFFPSPGGEPQGRDYTPRHFDPEARLLTIEFFLHEGGVGSDWAQRARPGDTLLIGGPRGSTVVSAPGAWWLLVGDETALPSVGRRLEEFSPGTQVIALLAVTTASEERQFQTPATLATHWTYRPDSAANDPGPLLAAFAALQLPSGPGFLWIAAEAEIARAVRSYAVERRGHPEEWIKSSAYWTFKSDQTHHGQ